MKVTFAFLSPEIASSRLRAGIPQRELERLGIQKGHDVLVYGKHVVSRATAERFKYRIYDVCDDHFHTYFENYYREHCEFADLVTVNSEAMREIVLLETGRKAIVIPDPYESDEKPAGYGNGVLWYGHQSNLQTIKPYRDLIDVVLTGDEWSREKQLKAIEDCAVVVIPTDSRKGKSANRLIEAVRNGRFVVAGKLPAHNEFKPYMWIGDIEEGLEWAKTHRTECIHLVKECQEYVRDRFSPETIGKLWLQAINTLGK